MAPRFRWSHYLKSHFEISKIWKNNFACTFQYSMFTYNFLGERNILRGLCKNTKNVPWIVTLDKKNVFFTQDTRNVPFPKISCVNIFYVRIYMQIFYFQIFWHFDKSVHIMGSFGPATHFGFQYLSFI